MFLNIAKIRFVVLWSAIALMMHGLVGCEDDFRWEPTGNALIFSQDTLTFDTVFTTIGSATAKLLVYNASKKPVTITHLALAGGAGSSYRINVDGAISPDNTFQEITIRGRDSLYVFVEVTIRPNDANSPVLVLDSLIFQADGKQQRVLLEAFGQDMELLRNVILRNDTVLSANKPYLIYGYLAVDSLKTLRLPAGTQLYFHHNAGLYVYGNLIAEGTYESPVTMQGSRRDKINFTTPVPYRYVAGQWGGVYLLSPTGQHELNHVQISSGYVGLYMMNNDRSMRPTLNLHNSRVHNFLFYNLVAVNADVLVTNSEISNSGSFTVYLNGGNHTFYHCTIVNYFNFSAAQAVSRDRQPAVMMMDLNRSVPNVATFRNCVISGTAQNEFSIASKFPERFNAVFSHSYLRRTSPLEGTQFSDNRWYAARDTVFKQVRYDYKENIYFDFTPDSVSPLRGLADPALAEQFPLDLHGNNRLEDGSPDAGAYEYRSKLP